MVADDLAMQGARASAAMVLMKSAWNVQTSAPNELSLYGHNELMIV